MRKARGAHENLVASTTDYGRSILHMAWHPQMAHQSFHMAGAASAKSLAHDALGSFYPVLGIPAPGGFWAYPRKP